VRFSFTAVSDSFISVDWSGIAQNPKLLCVSLVHAVSWQSAYIIWPTCRSFRWCWSLWL